MTMSGTVKAQLGSPRPSAYSSVGVGVGAPV